MANQVLVGEQIHLFSFSFWNFLLYVSPVSSHSLATSFFTHVYNRAIFLNTAQPPSFLPLLVCCTELTSRIFRVSQMPRLSLGSYSLPPSSAALFCFPVSDIFSRVIFSPSPPLPAVAEEYLQAFSGRCSRNRLSPLVKIPQEGIHAILFYWFCFLSGSWICKSSRLRCILQV